MSRTEFLRSLGCQEPDHSKAGALVSKSVLEVLLHFLDAETLKKIIIRSSDPHSPGVMESLEPFLVDHLKRRLNLCSVIKMSKELLYSFEYSSDQIDEKAMKLLSVLCKATGRDLFIALLSAANSPTAIRLVSLFSRLDLPIPLLYPLSAPNSAQSKYRFELPSFAEVLSIPTSPLIVSLGSSQSRNRGKSFLLGPLFWYLDRGNSPKLEVTTQGYFHSPSIDLSLDLSETPRGYTLADVHGFDSTNQSFCAALCLLFNVSAGVLVHVWADDFDQSGTPLKDLKMILETLSQSQADQIQTDSKNVPSVVVLFRDVEKFNVEGATFIDTCFEKVKKQMAKYHVVHSLRIRDMTEQILTGDFGAHVPHIRKALLEKISSSAGNVLASFPELIQQFQKILTFSAFRSQGRPLKHGLSLSGDELGLQRIPLDLVFLRQLLEEAANDKCFLQSLFPFSFIESKKHSNTLESQRLGLLRSQVLSSDQIPDKIDSLMSQNKDLTGQRKVLKRSSKLVEIFAKLVRERDEMSIQQLEAFLFTWKRNLVKPLHEKRRNLIKQQGAIGDSDPSFMSSNQQEIERLRQQIEDIDVGIDFCWRELIAMASITRFGAVTLLEEEYSLSKSQLSSILRENILGGTPFQLIDYSLNMNTGFVSDILRSITSKRKLFVVSVIGLQSSAKSTLLNVLFGCSFTTSASRCTKGLYMSYLTCSEKEIDLVVLDSEGLMSLEARDPVFDKMMTLMALACSHVVIINYKGQMTSNVRSLLEVCLYAMKHLKITKLRPKLHFALRDMTSTDLEAQSNSLSNLRSELQEVAQKLKIRLEDFIDVDENAIELLPSAVTLGDISGKDTIFHEGRFPEQCKSFRLRLLRYSDAFKTQASSVIDHSSFSSISSWLSNIRSSWKIITQQGDNLLHWETYHEIELYDEISKTASQVVNRFIDEKMKSEMTKLRDEKTKQVNQSPSKLGQIDTEFQQQHHNITEECVLLAQSEFQKLVETLKSNKPQIDRFQRQVRLTLEREADFYLMQWKIIVQETFSKNLVSEAESLFRQNMTLELANTGQTMSGAERDKHFELIWNDVHTQIIKKIEDYCHSEDYFETNTITAFNDALQTLRTEDIFHLFPKCATLRGQQLLRDIGNWQEFVSTKLITRVSNAVSQRWPFHSGQRSNPLDLLNAKVKEHLEEVATGVKAKESFDLAFAREILKNIGVFIQNSRRSLDEFHSSLCDAKFIPPFYLSVLQTVVNARVELQKEQQQKHLKGLGNLRKIMKERFNSMLAAQASDEKFAKHIAKECKNNFEKFLLAEAATQVLNFEEEIRRRVGSPSQAAEAAYEASFGSSNWLGVVHYCLDGLSFIKEIFEDFFEQASDSKVKLVGRELYTLLKRKQEEFVSSIQIWGDLFKAKSSLIEKTTFYEHFLAFLLSHSAPKPWKAMCQKLQDQGVKSCPPLTSTLLQEMFGHSLGAVETISDPVEFSSRLMIYLGRFFDEFEQTEIDAMIKSRIQSLHDVLWNSVRGCQALCPLCRSKCSLEPGHSEKHECRHQIAAFGGSRVHKTDHPVLDLCTQTKTHTSPWKLASEEEFCPNLDEFLTKHYPEWRPMALDDTIDISAQQQEAWVNCRSVLLKHYNLVDKTPDEWIRKFPLTNQGPLKYYDLQTTVNKEFHDLIGLDNVKSEVQHMIRRLVWQKYGPGSSSEPNLGMLNMMFYGNPGTGKTTVARIMAKILHHIGLTSANKFVECQRNHLIGKYIGETERLTAAKIQEARGGVLFVDEAYSLVDNDGGGSRDFGIKALETIMAEMTSDSADRVIFLFAGYEADIKTRFFRANAGLERRVPFKIHFNDFSPEDLTKIFESIVAKKMLSLDQNTPDAVLKAMKSIPVTVRCKHNGGIASALFSEVESVLASSFVKPRKPSSSSATIYPSHIESAIQKLLDKLNF